MEEVNSVVRRCEKSNEKYKDPDFDLDDEDCWWGLGMIQPITCANGSKRVGVSGAVNAALFSNARKSDFLGHIYEAIV